MLNSPALGIVSADNGRPLQSSSSHFSTGSECPDKSDGKAPSRSSTAHALGASKRPAPISPNSAACSRTSAATPLWRRAIATANPAIPPPTMMTSSALFMKSQSMSRICQDGESSLLDSTENDSQKRPAVSRRSSLRQLINKLALTVNNGKARACRGPQQERRCTWPARR